MAVAPESTGTALSGFHPLLQKWFQETLGAPSEPQVRGWPLIRAGGDTLIAAPTGSGKTLTAFLACLDALFQQSLAGTLADETTVLYVSPLKALGNDVQKNLLLPLEQLEARARAAGYSPQPIRVQVRTGDTPSSERAQMLKKPPHIFITTPESLYLCLTAERSRAMLRTVRTVVVDELHALARDKRGSHFALSMERLKALCPQRPQCIGLSATQKPIERFAMLLTGLDEQGAPRPAHVVQVGHVRPWELTVEVPDDELSAVATHEMWGQVYERIVDLTQKHRTVLAFANTRRLAERIAHDLGQRLGPDRVAAHHGSLARELRLVAEEKLKAGQLSVMVATASLELGIDIGAVDVVCQFGSPRSIAVMLQRLGRSGHWKGGISRGVLFAMTRDELVECAALVRAIREGELDSVPFPETPVDVLAQQVVAEVAAAGEVDERALYGLFKQSLPFRALSWERFDQVLQALSDESATGRGRARVHLHRDRVHGKLRARKGARLAAIFNGGAIPDTFNYPVVAVPDEQVVGSVDEDFAVESMAGDVFLLGSTSWRIQRVMAGTVRVEDAKGQAPTVPFWRGEAPSRTDELSLQVSRLREEVLARADAPAWLTQQVGLSEGAGDLLVRYLRAGHAALGAVPTQHTLIAERFFDEAGGMQLIIHSPYGGRINRAWGMALRKSFCRAFDFELQAAASDDGILLSLGEQHSFPLEDIFRFCAPKTVENVLTQAVLQAPLFGTRFRWTATRALALSRFQMGKRVPPAIQRARAEDLMAAVFPAQVACQDNRGGGDVELSDHPWVQEAMADCLHLTMDLEGLKALLEAMRSGAVQTRAVDLPEPSVFAHQMLNSAPYTFLDEAPLEERRARAVSMRRTLSPDEAAAFGALDAAAIAQVVSEAQPELRSDDEVHDALLQLVLWPEAGAAASPLPALPAGALQRLERDARVCSVRPATAPQLAFRVARERLPHALALFPDGTFEPHLAPLAQDAVLDREAAALAVVRGWMELAGPVCTTELAGWLGLSSAEVEQALFALEARGQVLRGQFRPGSMRPASARPDEVEWCDRRLLQRIHRLTVGRLRAEIEPLSARDFMRFLFRWHHLTPGDALKGSGGLLKAVSLLQGFEAPAAAWELALLPARLGPYLPELLERACFGGEVAWGRLTPREGGGESARGGRIGRNANLTFVRRDQLDWMLAAARPTREEEEATAVEERLEGLSHAAREVAAALARRGASFFTELVSASRRLPAEVEDGLWELLAKGWVTADAVQNLRVLQSPKARRRQRALARGGPGRWSLLAAHEAHAPETLAEKRARLFLQRYGIVFRDLVVREALAPPWRELLHTLRSLEARGEVRGGRFVAGLVGEQFALPEAVELARSVRRAPLDGTWVQLSAVDPLNLTGIVTPGPRVPAVLGNVIRYRDGVPVEPLEVGSTSERHVH